MVLVLVLGLGLGFACMQRRHEQKPVASFRIYKTRQLVAGAFESLFLGGTDAANGGSAIRAFALRDRLAVLRRALDGVHHNLLRLALDAIRFDRHFRPQSFFSGSDPIPTFLSNRDRQRSVHACLQRTAIIL